MASVNLQRLRDIAGGDHEFEVMMLRSFFASAYVSIRVLESSLEEGNIAVWQKELHALKGQALNLGADDLAEMCRVAELQKDTNDQIQRHFLSQMKMEVDGLLHIVTKDHAGLSCLAE